MQSYHHLAKVSRGKLFGIFSALFSFRVGQFSGGKSPILTKCKKNNKHITNYLGFALEYLLLYAISLPASSFCLPGCCFILRVSRSGELPSTFFGHFSCHQYRAFFLKKILIFSKILLKADIGGAATVR